MFLEKIKKEKERKHLLFKLHILKGKLHVKGIEVSEIDFDNIPEDAKEKALLMEYKDLLSKVKENE